MIEKTKVNKLGEDLVVVIPRAFAKSIGIKEGDEVQFSHSENGAVVSFCIRELPQTMEDAREFMRSHRRAFKQLGK